MRQWTVRSVVSVAVGLATLGVLVHRGWPAASYEYLARKLPDSKPAPDFTLTDQEGKPFSANSLRGKLVLMAFGFTHCPNICPTTLANLAITYKLLSPEEQGRVQVLFVTVDPERDTPKVLKDYVPFFDQHFIGLTGKPEQIAATAKAYGVEYQKSSQPSPARANDYTMDHSTSIFLIGRAGELVAFYRDSDLRNTGRMTDDLRHFLAFPAQGDNKWEHKKIGVVKAPAPTGRQLYLEECASCHLENGRGISGKYPSLVGSSWVVGAPNRLTAIVLNGVKGEHEVAGARYGGVMPAYRTVLTPAFTAAVLTYIRQSWGNEAPAISAAYVQNLFYKLAARADFWSWKELEALPPETNAAAPDL